MSALPIRAAMPSLPFALSLAGLFALSLAGCGGAISPEQGGQLLVESESPTQMTGRFRASNGAVLEFESAIAEGSSIKSEVIYQGGVVLSVSLTSSDALPTVSIADGRDPAVKLAAQEMASALTAKYVGQEGGSAVTAMVLSTGLAKVVSPTADLHARVNEMLAQAPTDTRTASCATCCHVVWAFSGCCSGWTCSILMRPYCC